MNFKQKQYKTREDLQKSNKKLTILSVVSICVNALLILFLILCGVLGSKNNKNNYNDTNIVVSNKMPYKSFGYNDSTKIYNAIFDSGTNNLSYDWQKSVFDDYVDLDTSFGSAQNDVVIQIDLPSCYLNDNGSRFDVMRLAFLFETYQIEYGDFYSYRLSLVYFRDFTFHNYVYVTKDVTTGDNSGYDYNYTFDSDLFYQIVFSDDIPSSPLFYDFYYLSKPTTFTFNKVFNYNSPLGLALSSQYGGSTSMATDIGYGTYRIIYDTGYFISHDTIYDAIVIDYNDAYGNYFKIDSSIRNGASGQLSYFALGYRRASDNLIDFINYRDITQGLKDGSVVTYLLSSSTWVNDNYRDIVFLTNISDAMNIKINAFNNNNQFNDNLISGGDFYDVFTLVGGAFTSLIPILSITILPYVTLGTLLFVPIVAMLVFAIIKIIRK